MCLKYGPKQASFFVYFRPFLNTKTKQYKILLSKCVDGVLEIRTRDHMMVRADKSTAPWRAPYVVYQLTIHGLYKNTLNPCYVFVTFAAYLTLVTSSRSVVVETPFSTLFRSKTCLQLFCFYCHRRMGKRTNCIPNLEQTESNVVDFDFSQLFTAIAQAVLSGPQAAQTCIMCTVLA